MTTRRKVSILVVLDDALVPFRMIKYGLDAICLNPCCAGRCSSTVIYDIVDGGTTCSLNPCCAGRCSSTGRNLSEAKSLEVSILVVLDDALVQYYTPCQADVSKVSILVVLDDALVRYIVIDKTLDKVSQSLLCWTML